MKEKYVLASNCARPDTLFKVLAIDENGNLTLKPFRFRPGNGNADFVELSAGRAEAHQASLYSC
jgi:hypothetical protein